MYKSYVTNFRGFASVRLGIEPKSIVSVTDTSSGTPIFLNRCGSVQEQQVQDLQEDQFNLNKLLIKLQALHHWKQSTSTGRHKVTIEKLNQEVNKWVWFCDVIILLIVIIDGMRFHVCDLVVVWSFLEFVFYVHVSGSVVLLYFNLLRGK